MFLNQIVKFKRQLQTFGIIFRVHSLMQLKVLYYESKQILILKLNLIHRIKKKINIINNKQTIQHSPIHKPHKTINMSSDQLDRQGLIQQLMRMLDTISQNAGYLRYFQNEQALIDPKIYFDICQIIFSELSIKLIKIQEYQGYDEGEKLDCLIKLITDELGIHMSGLSGKEIMKFNIPHIYQFLNLLLQYSKLYFERGSAALQPSVKTEPNQISADYEREDNMFSARPPGIVEYSPKSSSEEHQNNKRLKQNKNGTRNNKLYNNNEQKSTNGFSKSKKDRNNNNNQSEISQNVRPVSAQPQKKKKSEILYDELIKVVIDEKNRANKSSLRDQRKNKNDDIAEAKNKYHQYLKSYSRQKRADTDRKEVLRKRAQTIEERSNPRELPLKDFENVANFFKSFNLKLRDMKDVYIRRMKKQIRQKEQEKMVSRNRTEREAKKLVDKMISQQIDCLNHQHELRRSEIREASAQLQEEILLVKKEMKRKSSQRKRELKEMKKMGLGNLQNLIRQENQKILMELEEGGRMEKLILEAYGKF